MGTDGPGLDLLQKTGRKKHSEGRRAQSTGQSGGRWIKKAGALLKWRPPGKGGCQQHPAGIRCEKRWNTDVGQIRGTKTWEQRRGRLMQTRKLERSQKKPQSATNSESHDDDG